MANSIADAPVRATEAPARAKQPPTRREPDPTPQWLELGLQHTRRLCDLLYTLVNADAKAQGLIQDLVEAAEAQLHGLVSDESCIDVTADGALYCQIGTVATMLEAAWYAAEHGPLDFPPDLHAAVIPSAIAYAKGLAHALQESPLTDRFHALAQPLHVAGAQPFRDPPRPPIRRVDGEPSSPITAETEAHEAGEIGIRSVIRCSYDIEGIANAITLLGDEVDHEGDTHNGALLRCYGTRIKSLNGVLMSYLDADAPTLQEVQYCMYRGALTLPEGSLE